MDQKPPIPKGTRSKIINPAYDWARDFSVLHTLICDESVSEIMMNSYDQIFVERSGKILKSELAFENVAVFNRVVQAIANLLGKELNIRHPHLDARLPDGSRINMVIPPLTLGSPILTIRRFSYRSLTPELLIAKGSLDEKMAFFLKQAVIAKQNIIVSGGTGSGKTTLLNLLSSFIPKSERVITLEDTPELQLPVENLARLICKDATGSDEAITIAGLLRNALRMRPARIVVGECRGEEAWDMLQAMNTGHEGSMTTLHANSGFDASRGLEAMVLRACPEVPAGSIREDVSSTIDFVVQVARYSDGSRRISEIREIKEYKNALIESDQIFSYDKDGSFYSSGVIPKFAANIGASGNKRFPNGFFDPRMKLKAS